MEFSGERYLSNMNNAEMSYEHWHRYFYATQFVKEKDVLDIASGEGYGANLMARTAKTVLGVDISQEAIDFAKECYIRNNLSFLQGSVENIPVDGVKKFDVVVSFETIEHVNTGLQIAFLKEVKRLLKDDGIFIVSSPNKLFYSDISKFKNEFHFKEFYEEEFIDFLGKYFKHVSLLGQKIFTGSDIWHLDFSKREYSFSEYQIMNNGQRFVANDDKKEALFLVAVCSDVEVKFVEHSLLFDKSLSLLWENEKRLRDQKLASLRLSLAECTNELNSIYASKKWKLIIKVAAPVLFARQGISKIKSWMKRQLVTVFLKKCVNLTRRFFEITTDLGLRVAMAEVFLTLTGKNSVLIKPSSIPRDLSEDAFSIPEHLGFVEIFSALFKRLKLTVDAEKTWKLISSQLDFAALYKLQVEIFTLHRFFLTANAMSPCKLIQASTLPQRGGVPRKRNILFITSLFPNPIHGGGGRVMDFIKVLAENNTVYLYSFYNPLEDHHAYRHALRYCAGIRRVFLWNPAKNPGYIRDWLKDVSIDIVHYEWPESLTSYDPSLGKFHIFTYMESVSLRLLMDMSRENPLTLPWIEKLKNLIHYLKIELVDVSDVNVRVAVTTKDAEFFRSLIPGSEYTVLNHGISVDEFCLPDVEPKPYTLTFVGNFLHPPNGDALRFFFDSVWDDVLRDAPQTKIYIVGAYPSKWIRALSKQRNVFVTGKVSDIRPYIQKASVCIAPLISGAGLRGKVLQYASLRRTFVATPIAVTDLFLVDGSDYLQATNAKEFSENLVELLKNGERARQMGLTAFETVMRHYDNHRLVDYLTRIYDRLDEKIHA